MQSGHKSTVCDIYLFDIYSQKLAAFTVLCEKYQPSLQRDPSYAAYLDKIGQIFFGLPPPVPSGRQGLIGEHYPSLISSFLLSSFLCLRPLFSFFFFFGVVRPSICSVCQYVTKPLGGFCTYLAQGYYMRCRCTDSILDKFAQCQL